MTTATLTPQQLAGEAPANVYNHDMSGNRVLEGKAFIRRVLSGDAAGVHARVRFDGDDPSDTYDRWVFASDQ